MFIPCGLFGACSFMFDWSSRLFPPLPPSISQKLTRLPFNVAVRDVVQNDGTRVDDLRIRLLFTLGLYPLCIFGCGFFLAKLIVVSRGGTGHQLISIAVAALIAGAFSLVVQAAYRRKPERYSALRWETAFAASNFALGFTLVMYVATYPWGDLQSELLLQLIVVAMLAMMSAALAASWRAMAAVGVPAFLALAGHLALSSNALSWYAWIVLLGCVIGLTLIFAGTHLATCRAILRRVSNERSLAFQASVLQNGLLGILAVRNDKVVQCNAYLANLLGFDASHIEGHSVRQLLVSGDEETKLVDAMLAAERTERAAPIELHLRRRDGEALWCSVQAQRAVVVHSSNLMPTASTSPSEKSSLLFVVDIDQRKRSEAQLFESERAYRGLVEASPSMIFATDRQGHYMYVNQRGARALLMQDADSLTGKLVTESFDPSTRARDRAKFSTVQQGLAVLDYVCRLQRPDGSRIDVSVSVVPLFDRDGQVMGSQGTATDVTERTAHAQALRIARDQAHDAMESIVGACVLLDREERVVLCNRGFMTEFGQPTGYSKPVGMRFIDLLRAYLAQGNLAPSAQFPDAEEWLQIILKRHRAHTPEVFQDKQGRWHQLQISPASNGGRLLLYTDITALKVDEQHARTLANHDPLTGLPNRRLLDDRLDRAIIQARRMNQKVGIMVIDLDRFKPINDTYGHRAGDAVLVEVAKRFSVALREGDTVGRYGGDEFLVVLNGLKSIEDVHVAGKKLLKALAAPIAYQRRSLSVGGSIGASVFPDHGQLTSVLIRRADTAMYGVKGSGRNAIHVCMVDQLDRTMPFSMPISRPAMASESSTTNR